MIKKITFPFLVLFFVSSAIASSNKVTTGSAIFMAEPGLSIKIQGMDTPDKLGWAYFFSSGEYQEHGSANLAYTSYSADNYDASFAQSEGVVLGEPDDEQLGGFDPGYQGTVGLQYMSTNSNPNNFMVKVNMWIMDSNQYPKFPTDATSSDGDYAGHMEFSPSFGDGYKCESANGYSCIELSNAGATRVFLIAKKPQ